MRPSGIETAPGEVSWPDGWLIADNIETIGTIGINLLGRFIDGMKTERFAVAIWPLCYHRDT